MFGKLSTRVLKEMPCSSWLFPHKYFRLENKRNFYSRALFPLKDFSALSRVLNDIPGGGYLSSKAIYFSFNLITQQQSVVWGILGNVLVLQRM